MVYSTIQSGNILQASPFGEEVGIAVLKAQHPFHVTGMTEFRVLGQLRELSVFDLAHQDVHGDALGTINVEHQSLREFFCAHHHVMHSPALWGEEFEILVRWLDEKHAPPARGGIGKIGSVAEHRQQDEGGNLFVAQLVFAVDYPGRESVV
ncbi:hypothetical protein MMC22_002601 [Lobaria immixta]|nr:hypothetical protein [Lobaria immixta]